MSLSIVNIVQFAVIIACPCFDLVLGLNTGTSVNNTFNYGQVPFQGSKNRWRYDNIYKEKLLKVADSGANSGVRRMNANFFQRKETIAAQNGSTITPTIPTPEPLVDQNAKQFVQWFDESLTYGLNGTSDYRFKIRHAPIPHAGSPWPMPQLYHPFNISHRVDALALDFEVLGSSCPLLHTNFKRIKRNMFGHCEGNTDDPGSKRSAFGSSSSDGAAFSKLSVTVLRKCGRYPHLDMDESYDLVVKSSGVSIVSKEVWGALRGMETFSQLVYQDRSGQFWINEAVIQDFPRFKHRGVLLDTARHFIAKEVIIDNLEAMAQNKMNVFHWHIVDDQSFPYESKVLPNLTKFGSYDPETHVYTHEDIREIIEAGRVRGIRVIPEFDTPGHTFSWGYGQKHLLTPCYSYQGQPTGKYGPINPTLKKNYRFLKDLFSEVMTVFKDKYIHLGGDEVPFECWESNPFIQKFMKRNKLTDIRKVLNLYGRELIKIINEIGLTRKLGGGYIVWQEMFDNEVKLNPDTIVQVWSGDAYSLERITQAGMKAIFSTCWYLDYINYGQDWDKYYRCDALAYRTFNETLFIGGEVCLWTEYVDDDNIMTRLWPRASAAAERLWSSSRTNDVHEASTRIETQRCRMMRTGLKVGVLSGPGHCPQYRSRNRTATPCNVMETIRQAEVPFNPPVTFSPGEIIVFIVVIVSVVLILIRVFKRRPYAAALHIFNGGTTSRKLIVIFVAFVCAWLFWWLVRLTWGPHLHSSPSSTV